MEEIGLKDDTAINILKNLEARSMGYQKQALKQAIEYYELAMETEDIDESERDTAEL